MRRILTVLQLNALCAALWLSLVGCRSEVGETEIFVSIHAHDAAREASALRVQVNDAVVELPRTIWPLEVLVRAGSGADAEVRVRAFGLHEQTVVGAAEGTARFRPRRRVHLELTLDPGLNLGALPAVNGVLGPDGMVLKPDASLDGEDAGASDAGASDEDADAAEPGACDGGECTCTPAPEDCGGCGVRCSPDQQCLAETCKPIPASACSSHEYEGHAYLVCEDLRNWISARAACRELGYDLAIVDDPKENAFLQGIVAGGDDVWIGGHDRGDNGTSGCRRSAAEGTWHWPDPVSGAEQGTPFCSFATSGADSCTPVSGLYANWRAQEPNNASCSCGPLGLNLGFACTEGEDCGVLYASDGAWGDQACNRGKRYVCESY